MNTPPTLERYQVDGYPCFSNRYTQNSRGVTSMTDLSEIEDFTWTFFQQFLVGCFQSYEIPSPINQIIDYGFAIRILGRFLNIRIFEYSVPSLVFNYDKIMYFKNIPPFCKECKTLYFSFSHHVFKSLLLRSHKHPG